MKGKSPFLVECDIDFPANNSQNSQQKSLVYSSRAGNGDSNIDRDEVDKGNKTNNRISRIKSAVSKARERLKRDTSNSSCSSDSENILSSEEDADVPTSLNISNRGYVVLIKIFNRGSNLLINIGLKT